MRILFNSVNSVTNLHKKPKTVTPPSFGCKCVKPENIFIPENIQQKLDFRDITIEVLHRAILKGRAYIDKTTKRVMIFYKPTPAEVGNKLVVVLSRDKSTLITAFPPRDVNKFVENSRGELLQPGIGRVYIPLEPSKHKVVIHKNSNKRLVYDENGHLFARRTPTETGYVEKDYAGNVLCVKHVKKSEIDGRNVKFQTFYYPQKQQIQHRGERYNPDSPKYKVYKQLYFSEYE